MGIKNKYDLYVDNSSVDFQEANAGFKIQPLEPLLFRKKVKEQLKARKNKKSQHNTPDKDINIHRLDPTESEIQYNDGDMNMVHQ